MSAARPLAGVVDIYPFVLGIAQGSAALLTNADATIKVLVATASNDVLEAAYTAGSAGFRSRPL